MPAYFEYGDEETSYLAGKDTRLAAAIERIGHVNREVHTGLFDSVIHSIVGQQISTKAQATIWERMHEHFGELTPQKLANASADEIQALGLTFRKVDYIQDFCRKVESGEFDLRAIEKMSDEEAIKELSALRGIGVWTAEMILLFCLQRPNILSFDDLAIQRGMRMVLRHRKIDRKLFEKYRRKFSPYCSVASLYFWAVAGGAIPELTDPAPKKK